MKIPYLSIIGISIITILIFSFPVSLELGYGSIAKPVITLTPLKIFKEGVPVEDIACKEGLLIIKVEDGSPACVMPNTAHILVERGWAKPMVGGIIRAGSATNLTNNDPFGLTTLVIYQPSFRCLGPLSNTTTISCPPNNFYLKINSNSTAYLLGYNICDANSCAKNNTLSVLLPINNISKPNYQMIGLPVNLQWSDGDPVNIQLRVSATPDSRSELLIDKGNSTIVP